MICKNCGKIISSDNRIKFCRYCGATIQEDDINATDDNKEPEIVNYKMVVGTNEPSSLRDQLGNNTERLKRIYKNYEYYIENGDRAKDRGDKALAEACYLYAELFAFERSRFGDVQLKMLDVFSQPYGETNVINILKNNNIEIMSPVKLKCEVERNEGFWKSLDEIHFALRKGLVDMVMQRMTQKDETYEFQGNEMFYTFTELFEVEKYLFMTGVVDVIGNMSEEELSRLQAICDSSNIVRDQMLNLPELCNMVKYLENRRYEYQNIAMSNIKVGAIETSCDVKKEYEDDFRFVVRKCSVYCAELIYFENEQQNCMAMIDYLKRVEQPIDKGVNALKILSKVSNYSQSIWSYHFDLLALVRELIAPSIKDLKIEKDEKNMGVENDKKVILLPKEQTFTCLKCGCKYTRSTKVNFCSKCGGVLVEGNELINTAVKPDISTNKEENKGTDSVKDELVKYKEMYDEGLIDQEEYSQLKKRVLKL